MGFYGNSDTRKREESWLLLKCFSSINNMSRVRTGGFNEIMHSGEKEGGSSRLMRQMANFCEVINSCQLHDLATLVKILHGVGD